MNAVVGNDNSTLPVDEFVVMPNHLHGIVMIYDRSENVRATQWVAPTNPPVKLHSPVR